MTQSPLLDKILRKNVITDTLRQYVRPTALLTILSFVSQAIKEKKEKIASSESKVEGQNDFLTRYIELQKHNLSGVRDKGEALVRHSLYDIYCSAHHDHVH
jgi:hypothetical protein